LSEADTAQKNNTKPKNEYPVLHKQKADYRLFCHMKCALSHSAPM
jgi:hypothetical protein